MLNKKIINLENCRGTYRLSMTPSGNSIGPSNTQTGGSSVRACPLLPAVRYTMASACIGQPAQPSGTQPGRGAYLAAQSTDLVDLSLTPHAFFSTPFVGNKVNRVLVGKPPKTKTASVEVGADLRDDTQSLTDIDVMQGSNTCGKNSALSILNRTINGIHGGSTLRQSMYTVPHSGLTGCTERGGTTNCVCDYGPRPLVVEHSKVHAASMSNLVAGDHARPVTFSRSAIVEEKNLSCASGEQMRLYGGMLVVGTRQHMSVKKCRGVSECDVKPTLTTSNETPVVARLMYSNINQNAETQLQHGVYDAAMKEARSTPLSRDSMPLSRDTIPLSRDSILHDALSTTMSARCGPTRSCYRFNGKEVKANFELAYFVQAKRLHLSYMNGCVRRPAGYDTVRFPDVGDNCADGERRKHDTAVANDDLSTTPRRAAQTSKNAKTNDINATASNSNDVAATNAVATTTTTTTTTPPTAKKSSTGSARRRMRARRVHRRHPHYQSGYMFRSPLPKAFRHSDLLDFASSRMHWKELSSARCRTLVEEKLLNRMIELERLQRRTIAYERKKRARRQARNDDNNNDDDDGDGDCDDCASSCSDAGEPEYDDVTKMMTSPNINNQEDVSVALEIRGYTSSPSMSQLRLSAVDRRNMSCVTPPCMEQLKL